MHSAGSGDAYFHRSFLRMRKDKKTAAFESRLQLAKHHNADVWLSLRLTASQLIIIFLNPVILSGAKDLCNPTATAAIAFIS
jgi:hypothetical protein